MAVPVVDFSACGLQRANVDVEDMRSAARELHAAFTQVGLVFLQNSGISPEEVRRRSRRRTGAPGQDSAECLYVCRSGGLWIQARGSSSCQWRRRRSSGGVASQAAPTMDGYPRGQSGEFKLLLLLNNMQELGTTCVNFFLTQHSFQYFEVPSKKFEAKNFTA